MSSQTPVVTPAEGLLLLVQQLFHRSRSSCQQVFGGGPSGLPPASLGFIFRAQLPSSPMRAKLFRLTFIQVWSSHQQSFSRR